MNRVGRIIRTLDNYTNHLDFSVALVGAAAIFGMALAIVWGVVKRYLLSSPEPWSFEISTYLLLAAVFLGAAYTQIKRGHVSVDLLTSRLPEKIRATLDVVTLSLALIFCSILLWKSSELAWRAYHLNWKSSSSLALPLFPTYVLLPIGYGLLCLSILVMLTQHIGSRSGRSLDDKGPEGED